MSSHRSTEPTLPERSSDESARASAGILLLFMSAFIVVSLYFVFSVALWSAPDAFRGGDMVFSACFIGGVAFGGLSGAFVAQWLLRWHPRACFRVGIVVWSLISIGLAIIAFTK